MKTKLTLFVTVLAVALFGVGCASPLEKGLVAHYPFNGNSMDESGNGNHGAVSGAILTTDRHGKEENAYLFDNQNDYIDIPNHPSLHLNNEMTITIWLKLDSLPNNRTSNYILTKAWYEGNDLNSYARRGIQMKISDYKNWDAIIADSYSLSDGVSHDQPAVPFSYGIPFAKIPLKRFFHVAYTYDGEYVRAYMDGVFFAVSNKMQGTLNAIKGNLQIGSAKGLLVKYNPGSEHHSFIGAADDIRIYNRALSADEVKVLYDLEKPKSKTK